MFGQSRFIISVVYVEASADFEHVRERIKNARTRFVFVIIRARKTEFRLAVVFFNRIVNGGLSGKMQMINPAVIKTRLILAYAVGVGRKHIIRIRSGYHKTVGINGVFFIPEHNGNFFLFAVKT